MVGIAAVAADLLVLEHLYTASGNKPLDVFQVEPLEQIVGLDRSAQTGEVDGYVGVCVHVAHF